MPRLVSIVIPCFHSERTIKSVVDEIVDEFTNNPDYDFEIVLINDGSSDATYDIISMLCATNEHITGIDLSKNFGQGPAVMAGIQYVHGDYMICMDDDGQHPTAGIFQLIKAIDNGFDLVYGYFPQKKHSAFKTYTSKLNKIIQDILGNHSHNYEISSFYGCSAFAIKAVKSSKSPIVAGPTYLLQLTTKVLGIPMEHRQRLYGKSNYSIKRLVKLWRRTLTSFSTKLLDISIYLGMLCSLASILCAMLVLVKKIFDPNIQIGYASSMILMLMLAAIIMLLIGILGDYIGKMFMILIRSPLYYIRDIIPNIYCKANTDRKEPETNANERQ